MQAIKCVVLGDGAVGKLSKINDFCVLQFLYFSDWRYQFKQVAWTLQIFRFKGFNSVISFCIKNFDRPLGFWGNPVPSLDS